MQAIALRTRIPLSRRVQLTLPKSVPAGETDLIVVVTGGGLGGDRSPSVSYAHTGKKVRASKLFGMWKNRSDIVDSVALARSLRQQAEARRG